ncbi:hypothetical protein R3P38DRAFT_3253943 [Favolaschia claudopus]|uniref:Uncharacterized protein n=1 Tax=Favolaschia claudopus TaxID=2862362 RepID=A0AAW0DVR6_9AGAR
MPPIRRSRHAPLSEAPQAREDMNDFLHNDPHNTIYGTNIRFRRTTMNHNLSPAPGGVGGSGGEGGMYGGAGGNGEGPQFHISTRGTPWNILPSSYNEEHQQNLLVLILRRLSEYIEGDKEKALFVMYCALFAILLPGSLKLVDRLRLVPLIALPFLVIPSMLSLNDTITLVDVMGERRPILLAVWKNQEAFMTKLQEFFVRNEVIMDIIRSEQYQIQDAEYSVHRPGSRLVAAGTTLFMAALFYRSRMKCPWCDTQVEPVSLGWNLQISFNCMGCRRSFSTSNVNSPIPGNLDSDEASSSTLASDDPNVDQPSQRSKEPAGRRGPASTSLY